MSDMVKIENLKGMIIEIRGQSVLLDSDVAHLYGVETKRINEAVKNNPDKFPLGKRRLNHPFALSLSKGWQYQLIVIDLIRSWFDKALLSLSKGSPRTD